MQLNKLDVIRAIEKLTFVEATTMKNIPHEYTVKQAYSLEKSRLYEFLFKYILSNHYVKYFYGKPYKYCDIGDYTYWIMSDDIKVSKIINRVKRSNK